MQSLRDGIRDYLMSHMHHSPHGHCHLQFLFEVQITVRLTRSIFQGEVKIFLQVL